MVVSLFKRMKREIVPRRVFSGPEGKRLYAIGDIHGRRDLLDELLDRIAADIAARPVDAAVLVFLGDFIDRGPDSAGVIERLSALGDFPARAVFLQGNHEEILLRVLDGEEGLAYDWLGFGGDACVESYNVSSAALKAKEESNIARTLLAAIPERHIAFLRDLGDTVRFGDYLLVHAGIRPGIAIEEQQPHDLRWIRDPFLSDQHDHGCMVIHGHTISNGVDRRSNRLGIDTGAYRSNVLTAAIVEESELRFIATGDATESFG
jgi:serine/threonine protein phosphatase 1